MRLFRLMYLNQVAILKLCFLLLVKLRVRLYLNHIPMLPIFLIIHPDQFLVRFPALYQARFQALRIPSLVSGNNPVTSLGWAINEIAVNGQVRYEDWLGSVKVFRSRYPIDVEGFSYNPAFHRDTVQFQVGGGKVYRYSDKIDLYAGLSYLFNSTNTDNRGGGLNKPIPFTNSYLDFPRFSHGPGLSGMIGYIFNEKVSLNAGATLYPIVFTSFEDLSTNNIGYHGLLDAGINVKVRTLPGVYITGGYTNQLFFGFSNYLDDSNFFNIGVSLDPFKMANISSMGN